VTITKQLVLEANKWIVDKGLVELTWGNVSFYDRSSGLVYIKPSGTNLILTSEADISCIDITGSTQSGMKPSVDAPTHLKIYECFDSVNSVVHTHSKYATIFAQSGLSIPCLGTTHADCFYGDIPCVNHPDKRAISTDYERSTGEMICRHFSENKIDPLHMRACLIKGHAPFIWGKNIKDALEAAYVLEIVAEYAYKTMRLNPEATLDSSVLNKHFLRKHGSNKYYGQ